MEPAHLDESGAFMLDLDPDYFAPILNYLRFDKLIVDQALSQQGVLETARFLQLTVRLPVVHQVVFRLLAEPYLLGCRHSAGDRINRHFLPPIR